MKIPFYLNEVLTGRFRRVITWGVALIALLALLIIGRAFFGYMRSIGHSYHQADNMSDDAP